MKRCPHHGLPKWLVVQTFYQGISPQTRLSLDMAANGSLMNKTHQEVMELIEDMALNSFQWGSNDTRIMRKNTSVIETDDVTAIHAKIDALTRQLSKMQGSGMASTQNHVSMCELCGGIGHVSQACEVGNPFSTSGNEIVNFVSNQGGNPFSNTYNPG